MRYSYIILAVVLLVVLNSIFYVVQEPEQVIITQFGKPVGEPLSTPGLKAKLPFIQTVHRFDRRFLEWDGDANELPTRDKRFIWVDTYARWRITDPLRFFQRLRDERGARTRLDDILDGETRNAVANHDLVELIRTSNRTPIPSEAEIEDESVLEDIQIGREAIRRIVLEKAQTRTQDLGIEILDLQFKRINYVEEVRREVYVRMIAERKRIADRYRSEGEGEAFRIDGNRERDLKEIQSEAYRLAQEIVGKADGRATEIYAQAYNRSAASRSFYSFIRTLEAYDATLNEKSVLVLSTDGDFYKWLKQAEGR